MSKRQEVINYIKTYRGLRQAVIDAYLNGSERDSDENERRAHYILWEAIDLLDRMNRINLANRLWNYERRLNGYDIQSS